ncbi:hypothetical protein LEP1GSC193_2511 [Leptospira alstonii serovar Pingchang str. 80-412]|uniref:Uncharacterized protein n=2 Tax=Leptospira alstonii TaxID=28452 RepID=M6D205_9LEPT|nr:hypothetical protein LEP1GSC194_2549 [Leptospira alstonii serovar Sichuan str. 79601]EQA81122.1 hypothetical protein LEP1GSC193_2511 [Leptospira alstonii serovar Pingchang str. 80-412]
MTDPIRTESNRIESIFIFSERRYFNYANPTFNDKIEMNSI